MEEIKKEDTIQIKGIHMENTKTIEIKNIHEMFPDASQSYKKILSEIKPFLSGSDTKVEIETSHLEVAVSNHVTNLQIEKE